jgi:hypothetical protein
MFDSLLNSKFYNKWYERAWIPYFLPIRFWFVGASALELALLLTGRASPKSSARVFLVVDDLFSFLG